jgi:hypothetical protein
MLGFHWLLPERRAATPWAARSGRSGGSCQRSCYVCQFSVARNRCRIDAKHGDHFLQADFQVVVSKAREHTVLVQAHCPSRFRYNPNTCRSLFAKAETHLPGKHVLRFPRIPNAQTFETRRTQTMRRKIDRQATDEDGGRRDENRRACSIFIDYFVINASLPR